MPVVTSLDISAGLNDEQKEIQGLASRLGIQHSLNYILFPSFAMNELFPNMAKWDQEETFPVETLKYVCIFLSPDSNTSWAGG